MQDPVNEAAFRLMGISYLFPFQRLVVANILDAARTAGIAIDGLEQEEIAPDPEQSGEGRQLVILPTGAGKSLCFQLPALLMQRPTLVLYPILSLMADQERRLREQGFEPVLIRGGQSRQEREQSWQRAAAARFIIANPEVLLTDSSLQRLKNLNIAHLVLDEAHCISEWGESFRPSYLRIAEIIKAASPPLITAFTATASPTVLEKIKQYVFGTEGAHSIIGNADRANIAYSCQGAILKNTAVRDILRVFALPAIVFCGSRNRVEQIARYLRIELDTNEVKFYHAGLERHEKDAVERWFFSSPNGILCATCAYGMGVDKADIRTVVHRDCPPSIEAYLQESGRAGRDGKDSHAVLIWGPEDDIALANTKTETDRNRLLQLLSYGRDTGHCRRKALIQLLGSEGEACIPGPNRCDVCEGTASRELREEHSFTAFVRQNRRRYTIKSVSLLSAASPDLGIEVHEATTALHYLIKKGSIHLAKRGPWKGRVS